MDVRILLHHDQKNKYFLFQFFQHVIATENDC